MKEQSLRRPVTCTLTVVVVVVISTMEVGAETGPGTVANPQAVREVTLGTRPDANVAWWGFNAEDSTQFLQAAIDSGAPTVVIPYMGPPWIITPINPDFPDDTYERV